MIARLLEKLPPKLVVPVLTFALGSTATLLFAQWRTADKALAATVAEIELRMRGEEKETATAKQAYRDIVRRLENFDQQMDRMEDTQDRMEDKLDLLLERGRKK